MAKKKIWTKEDLVFEEKYRENQFKNVKFKSSGPEYEARMKENQIAAANTIKERKIDVSQPISIKIPQGELENFRKNAEAEGLKYQTKINQLIYQYNRNQLKYVGK